MGKVHLTIFLLVSAVWTVTCDDGDLSYPCGTDVDNECAKQYFGNNGDCKILGIPIKLPRFNLSLPLYVPAAHATAILTDVTLNNLETGVIKSLYVNNTDNNLVISIHFDNLSASDKDAIFIIDRVGREPKVLRESASATYTLTLTAVIPTVKGITKNALKSAQFSANIEQNKGSISIGPKLSKSSDPEIIALMSKIGANLDLVQQQMFRTKSSMLFLAWLQNNICDFNLKPIQQLKSTNVVSKLLTGVADNLSFLFNPCLLRPNTQNCVREYFESSGNCTKVSTSGSEPVTRNIIYNYIPSSNATVIEPKSQVSGLSGNIQSINVNPVSGNAIISMQFDGIVVETPETEIIIHQEGEEAVTITGYSKITYPVTITGVIPLPISAASIAEAYVSTYLTSTPKLELGSTITESEDPVVIQFLEELTANIETAANELLVTAGYSYFLMALQNNICDFEIPYVFEPQVE